MENFTIEQGRIRHDSFNCHFLYLYDILTENLNERVVEINTSSAAQLGGGTFKKGKLIGD